MYAQTFLFPSGVELCVSLTFLLCVFLMGHIGILYLISLNTLLFKTISYGEPLKHFVFAYCIRLYVYISMYTYIYVYIYLCIHVQCMMTVTRFREGLKKIVLLGGRFLPNVGRWGGRFPNRGSNDHFSLRISE